MFAMQLYCTLPSPRNSKDPVLAAALAVPSSIIGLASEHGQARAAVPDTVTGLMVTLNAAFRATESTVGISPPFFENVTAAVIAASPMKSACSALVVEISALPEMVPFHAISPNLAVLLPDPRSVTTTSVSVTAVPPTDISARATLPSMS